MVDLALFSGLLGALLLLAGIILAGAAFESARRRASPWCLTGQGQAPCAFDQGACCVR